MTNCYFVAVFQGMHQTECSAEYELALIRAARAEFRRADRVEVRTACFSPPLHAEVGGPAWVSYEPLPGETHHSTTNVPRLWVQLERSMAESWRWFEELPEHRRGRV